MGVTADCRRKKCPRLMQDPRRHYTEPVTKIAREDCEELIVLALSEDAPDGDPTSEAIFDQKTTGRARLVSREAGVLCGIELLPHLFSIYAENFGGHEIELSRPMRDGQAFRAGDELCRLEGRLRDILRLERILLNFLQYLSGIASVTADAVERAGGGISILDTRKTLPGYRRLAKYAVYCGGGTNHRIHLSDMAMIKDNHVAAAGGIQGAVERVHQRFPNLPLNVEVDTLDQLDEVLALSVPVDVILLDNMGLSGIETALERIAASGKSPIVELSGGWTPDRFSELEGLHGLGISMGYLTHTTRFLDLSLEIAILDK